MRFSYGKYVYYVFLLWKIICYDVLSKLDSDTIIIQYFYMLGGI